MHEYDPGTDPGQNTPKLHGLGIRGQLCDANAGLVMVNGAPVSGNSWPLYLLLIAAGQCTYKRLTSVACC